ncbi:MULTISPECIES: GNAT family N-acetyltransferase [Niastella]|uniref:GNAT family N-acetyltransferase n=1 Tax=Niastella soli TaxID=2821487 RepID=A0ABS3YY42_9BACT|nr:GNAT family N-acetyltransferase [Niastella soli]MBO9202844.1 GNAT family N-acetyltransferase [Niastella soli]
MENSIVTRFCIGTEQGQGTLLFLGKETANEKYTGNVPPSTLTAFIEDNFSYQVLDAEMNSMSNQFLVVYADGIPAGYARITSKGERPEIFKGKSVIRIADFSVLKKYNEIEVKKSLFEKCLSVCGLHQIIWISEYDQNPDLDFFASYGFVKNTTVTGANELGLPLVYMVKSKECA